MRGELNVLLLYIVRAPPLFTCPTLECNAHDHTKFSTLANVFLSRAAISKNNIFVCLTEAWPVRETTWCTFALASALASWTCIQII